MPLSSSLVTTFEAFADLSNWIRIYLQIKSKPTQSLQEMGNKI